MFNILRLPEHCRMVEAVRMLVQELGREMLLRPSSSVRPTSLLSTVATHDQVDVLKMLVDEFAVHEYFQGVPRGQTCKNDEEGAEEEGDGQYQDFPMMHCAALVGRLKIPRYLIEELKIPMTVQCRIEGPASANERPIRGTVLHAAAGSYFPEETVFPLVKWLVENGLDPEIENAIGQTAAELAQECGHNKIYAFLTRQKAAEEADAAGLALLAELDAEEEMQAKKKEKNKKKKDKKKQQKKQGTEDAKEEEDVTAAAAMGGLRLSNDEVAAEKSEKQDEDVPAAFLCGLTGKLMQHPVVAQDGVSFERSALQQYIAQAKASGKTLVSPATGERMGEVSLPNHLLRAQIDEWMEERKK
jgi:hypothetical protein